MDNETDLWKFARWYYWLFVMAFPLLLIIILYSGLPSGTICLFHIITGFDCPGCGMTRAFHAMLQLDVVRAFRYNPLGPIVFFIVILGWCYALLRLITAGDFQFTPWWKKVVTRFFWLLLWVYLVIGIFRLGMEISGKLPVVK